MKKLIVEEVNLFRAEVRAAAPSSQKGSAFSDLAATQLFRFLRRGLFVCGAAPRIFRLSLPTRNDIAASLIREGAPADGTTSGYYNGQTPQQGGPHVLPARSSMTPARNSGGSWPGRTSGANKLGGRIKIDIRNLKIR
jgi:hypothetical protein